MGESKKGSSSHRSATFKQTALIVLLVICISLTAALFVGLQRQDRIDNANRTLTSEQRLIARSIVAEAFEAAQGSEEAFDRLTETRDRFGLILELQKNGDADADLPASPASVVPYIDELQAKWLHVRSGVDSILSGRETVLSVSDYVPLLEGVIPQLLNLSDEVASGLVEARAQPKQIHLAARQLLLGQRMETSLNRMLAGGTGAAMAADAFARDVALFGRVLKGMAEGDSRLGVERFGDAAIQARLAELTTLFRTIEEDAESILRNSPELFQVQSATQRVAAESDGLSESINQLYDGYGAAASEGLRVTSWLPPVGANVAYGFASVSLGLLLILVFQQIRDSRLRLTESEDRKHETEDQNRRNQQAILRLLDEMGDLAEGDLTVQTTVTEDITGAIADSVNYAVEALRGLVITINRTSERVASAARETRAVADRLAKASEVQARQIETSSKTVTQMAQSMDTVSDKAASSAEVAEKSVGIAHQGGDRVRRTIQGMDAIREHIQETSKRIKRLGESSQEIGDIVALINDIADQTNILALNAAIQASAAGEAGRGFGVVADEVQRLAERSGNATKRIEALVKTIQADTNEAVISMEKSTSEVVNGAGLAEKAGESLDEIETVSARLAELIADISKAAREVSEMSARVSTAMTAINEITGQTAEGSVATASSISQLSQLAQEMQQTVAGFRLPEQV